MKVGRNSGRANKLNNLGNFRRMINAMEIIEKDEERSLTKALGRFWYPECWLHLLGCLDACQLLFGAGCLCP